MDAVAKTSGVNIASTTNYVVREARFVPCSVAVRRRTWILISLLQERIPCLGNKEASVLLNLMCSGRETDVALHQAFLPESHIPAKSAGQHRGMWSADSGQWNLRRLGDEMSSWLKLEAGAQSHFAWPPSPTARMAAVAGTNCCCAALCFGCCNGTTSVRGAPMRTPDVDIGAKSAFWLEWKAN